MFEQRAQTAEEAAFERKKLADLTVAEFRVLMAQIAWDEKNKGSVGLVTVPRPPLPKEPGDWGASIVAHPVHIAEQRRQNQEARDTADGAMDPKEPA